MGLTESIIIASHIPIAVSAVYALAVYKQLGPELKVFSFFLFFSAVIQLSALGLALNRINNLPLLHIYVAAGFFLLTIFYKKILNGFIHPRIIWGIGISFLVYTVLNTLFFEPIRTFNSMALTVESILVVILSLVTFIVLLNDIARERRSSIIKSINWINSGLFIYYSSSLLIFYFTRNFPLSINQYTWILHSFLSIAMYSCFYIGLWKRQRR
jgi:hypothetical protein